MRDAIFEAIEQERRRVRSGQEPQHSIEGLFDSLRNRFAAALAFKVGGSDAAAGDEFADLSFHRMVEALLSARGIGWTTRPEMIERGITTNDVPKLLEGTGNHMLRTAYETYLDGLLKFCGRVPARDFRDITAIQVEGAGLQEIPEGGPFARGTVTESAEGYSISTFGRILDISRTALLEDDLQGFARLITQLGRAAAEFAAAKVVAILESNPTLSDGVAAFNAAHGNLGTTGALSEATLGEALKLMRAQVGASGNRISVPPVAVLVPGALEFAARKLVTLMGNPPPISVAVEPRLTSATAFYLLADPALVPAITYTTPGADGPVVEVGRRSGFLGLQIKVRMDFGAGFVDHRGAVKNAGA